MKVVVFNNGTLGFVELEQKSTGFLDFGTELRNPNFAAMAEAAGMPRLKLFQSQVLCTGAIAHKQGNAKIGFRLGNMQSIGRFQKAVIGDYAPKSSNLINVYRLISDMPILMSKKYRLPYMTISV